MELLQFNVRGWAIDLSWDRLERMYRPSARALSLVNNGGRGGVQGEYRWEKVERTKSNDLPLGWPRTSTESFEYGLACSSSDDEGEDSPPVVNHRGMKKQ